MKNIVIVKLMIGKSGYRELDHTADWALQVWAPDLLSLLITSAKGMYALTEIETYSNEIVKIQISITSIDAEMLLVDFLSELLFIGETKKRAAIDFHLKLSNNFLSGSIHAAEILHLKKEIKAVTFHNLNIIESENGLETVIIFDV